jgi:lipoprotein-releasing system ATP-binding protein
MGRGTKPMLVEVSHLTKTYRAPDGSDAVEVLHDLDLRVDAGETVAILGPSGCGKSTLLNIIGALDQADSGEIRVAGQDLGKLDDTGLAKFRNETVGFVFQLHHLLPQCSILENVLVPSLALPKGDGKKREIRARELLEAVGLGHRVNHRPGQLSGGERQRAAVARALINQPKLLLADEPTGALDRVNATKLADLLLDMNRAHGLPVIMVTHAVDLARRMNRVLELADGRLFEYRP